MTVEFKVDTKGLEEFARALKLYPKEMRKPVSRVLGDMAWDFKTNIPKVIDSTYTIREQKLLDPKNLAFYFIERPKADTPIDQQRAAAGTRRTEGFTSWEEELTDKPREMRKNRGRYHSHWPQRPRGQQHIRQSARQVQAAAGRRRV
jgi:hypothetical protein